MTTHVGEIPERECAVALKEWSATCRALQLGRQIVLLRKGGLLDPEGVFSLEHSTFWLAPTKWHQDPQLVKPEHRDLLEASPIDKGVLALQALARVERSWQVREEEAALLARLKHIWSTQYLDSRWEYQPERPLLCVALRVWALPEAHHVPMQPEYSGCRSWIEMPTALPSSGAQPVLDENAFQLELAAVGAVLDE